jgi:serine/threonine protein kinase
MEKRIVDEVRRLMDRFGCCRVNILNPPDCSTTLLSDESLNEIRTNTNITINEDALVQHIPQSTKKLYPCDEKFLIKNLDSGKKIDIRDENQDFFISEFSSVTDCERNSASVQEFYERKKKMNELLWKAVESSDEEKCKALLSTDCCGSYVAQVNARGAKGESALHMAVKTGNLKICQILVENGGPIDFSAKDFEGRNALHLACLEGHYLIAQLLIRGGTVLTARDFLGNTPLHYAVMSGNLKLIKYMFHRFPILNVLNADGLSAADLMRNKGIDIGLDDIIVEHLDLGEPAEEEPLKITHKDFEAIQVLGRGSFGEVYLVKLLSTGQLYAMKMLRKEKIIEEDLIKYAMVERNILSRVAHPFIVKLNFAFQSEDKLYLVLDYCSGGNLTYYLRKEKHFTEEAARFYVSELVLALEELHRNGVIYRDLKPDNVVIDGQGHALLTDFGLSKLGNDNTTSSNSFCGSVAYMAPEMIRRSGHGMAVDWYLLGVLLYEMLVGFPPFYSPNREQLFKNIENAKVRVPARVSSTARDLIKKLMKRNLDKRLGFKNDATAVKNHPFFATVDWDAVLRKETVPPIPPKTTITPAFVPKFHMKERPPEDREMRYLQNWTFISK